MIFEIEDKKYDMAWGVFDEKISSLKRKKIIKIQIPLNLQRIDHSESFKYFKSLPKIDKVKLSKYSYSWVFLNCTIDKIDLKPTKWNDPYSALGDDKVVTIYITFEDVIGSHNDELIKGKLRDKKLKELFKS
jgi:hypothetical protein